MDTIDIIIPTIRNKQLLLLLEDLVEQQSVFPRKIFVIDNCEKELTGIQRFNKDKIMVEHIRMKERLLPHASWRLGFGLVESTYVTLLNDDVRVEHNFLERILETFREHPKIGVVCPTLSRGNVRSIIRWIRMSKREGWAWTIRKDLLDAIPPIPEELTMFGGDDWYFYFVNRYGYIWAKMTDCFCYHAPGASQDPKLASLVKDEGKLCRRLLHKYEMKFKSGILKRLIG